LWKEGPKNPFGIPFGIPQSVWNSSTLFQINMTNFKIIITISQMFRKIDKSFPPHSLSTKSYGYDIRTIDQDKLISVKMRMAPPIPINEHITATYRALTH
jgi:hypothetical protein